MLQSCGTVSVLKFLAGFILVLMTACGPSKRILYYDKELQPSNQPTPLRNYSAASERITVMTWNMENLYDTEDNPKTDDDTFLPLELKQKKPGHESSCHKKGAYSWVQQCLHWDWNESVLERKLEQLSKVILSVENGQGPDILVVQEVENLKVLTLLIDKYLPQTGYKAYLLENNDFRGIDVGLITRLELDQEIELKDLRSRPALSARFKLSDGSFLNLFGVHLPISPTPIEKRVAMIKKLKTFSDEKPNEYSMAIGDFNFPVFEEKAYGVIDKIKSDWVVSHLYCKDCKGTFYDSYDREFSQLDWILLSPNFFEAQSKWTLDINSIRVHKPLPLQTAIDDSPADFDLPEMTGVSDHWPFIVSLVRTSTK